MGGGREGELECGGRDGVKGWELWRGWVEGERVGRIEGVDVWREGT